LGTQEYRNYQVK